LVSGWEDWISDEGLQLMDCSWHGLDLLSDLEEEILKASGKFESN